MSQSCNQKKKSVGYCYLKEDASSVLNCNNFLHKLYFVGTANWGGGGGGNTVETEEKNAI